MIVTMEYLYEDPEESLALLEHLFNLSNNQGTTFVLKLDQREYIFPKSMEREVRIKHFRTIVEKHKPP